MDGSMHFLAGIPHDTMSSAATRLVYLKSGLR